MPKPTTRSFLLGLLVSVVILSSFFLGGLADRIFVLRPLDFFASRSGGISFGNPSRAEGSKLGQLIETGMMSSIPDVVDAASESVVTVSAKTQQQVFDPFSFFGINRGGAQVQEIQRDIGTGFVVGTNLIVTNKHVVSNLQASYKVIDLNDVEYEVGKIYRDPSNDLAILEVIGFDHPALPLGDSNMIRVGENVIAIGTALGEFRHTVTTGVISGLGRGIEAAGGPQVETLEGVIQTDAAINPGNSGGPLLSDKGEVIGVNVAVSTSAQNIGFAIPINVVRASVDNFNETGQFDRPFLGIQYQMITEQAALFNDVPQGAYVVALVQGGSIESAGIKAGDIIVAIDGVAIKDTDLATILNTKKIGDVVTVRFWRDKQFSETKVTLVAAQG
ncbi:MAG: peptidase S1 [Candidatus Pacebacteria bacterium CG10_big_fil_rev_8_21_14_0_10_42_12]|nr:MAG: peptidase S1 [Candidatus Pacebacteria bacterium CG10_big_fil_rev_8_21_14_0_10_42_12]